MASKKVVKKFRHCFKIVEEIIMVHHSENNANEKSSQVIIDEY